MTRDTELLEPLRDEPGLTVWLGRQAALGRLVEVVRLAPGVMPSSPHARRAVAQARAHSGLHHRSIREVFSLELSEQTLRIEREAAPGRRLGEVLEGLDIERRLDIVREILEALVYAHARRVLHGDLRLEQVICLDDGSIKLDGFQLALEPGRETRPSDDVTGAGLRCPEVRLGAPYGTLAEIYCFGCLAFELLTGLELGEFGDRGRLEPLLSLCPGLSPHVAQWLEACLDTVPAARPPSLAQAYERIFGQEQREVRRSPDVFVPGKWLRGGLLGLLVSAALGVGAMGTFFFLRKSEELAPRMSLVPIETDSTRLEARIRIVARPWAHVFVDGEFHDTTPFATPIHVAPGTHTIRFEHPQAAPEERIVQLEAGQTALLDVALRLTRPIVLERDIERPLETTP